jgi:hypothetical protein
MHPETGPCIMQGDRTLHHAASDGLFVSVCVCVCVGGGLYAYRLCGSCGSNHSQLNTASCRRCIVWGCHRL